MFVDIRMLDESCVKYNWKTLYVGVVLNMVQCTELTAYARKIMACTTYNDNEFVGELAWGVDNSLKDEILIKMLLEFNLDTLTPESLCWKEEIEKLIYTLLNYLRNTIKDDEELLCNVEEVYSDFGYPKNMDTFVRYMPVENNCNVDKNTIEYNYKYMINKLDEFLMLEKRKLVEDMHVI